MNNCEWTGEHKHRIIKIDTEEKTRGKHFIRRVKERWDNEFPIVLRTAQNLIDSASRSQKKDWELENDE